MRTVLRAAWQQAEGSELWQFEVAADAFLYRMVRRLVLFRWRLRKEDVPQKRWSVRWITELRPASFRPDWHRRMDWN